MRVLFAGTPTAAVPSLRALLESRHEVVEVLTRPDAPAGRNRRMTASAVADAAVNNGLPVWQPEPLSGSGSSTHLDALDLDVGAVVAYGALVPPELLVIPRFGWVNLHFSLLPTWRGAAPVQHALLAGDEVTGAATFQLEPTLDSGPVFGYVTETIAPTDTAGSLLERLAVSGARLLVSTLDGIAEGTLRPVPQADVGVTVAPKLTTFDAQVNWASPALHIWRQVRACNPAPGAWTTRAGERVKVWLVEPAAEAIDLPAGRMAEVGNGVFVGTGSQALRLVDVQPAGRARMTADAWLRGAPLSDAETLV